MSFSLFFQSLINGLNQGAIYALIALGYTMVYGIIRMINFAHGDFIMIGAYTLFYTIPLMVNAGMPAWLAVIVAIAVCAVVGVLVETFAYRPVRKAGPMSALITALAMSIFLENLAMVLFGAKPHNVQAIFSLPTITVGSVVLPLNVLLTIAIGLGIMIALQLFVKKTKLGKAMRAVGIHVTFEPYANEIGAQYGENPEYIAAIVHEEIRGLEENGLASCTKHWIGRGGDSAFGKARSVAQNFENWMVGWKAALSAGSEWVMTNCGGTGISNTVDVKWDKATMSYLRDTLGFDGVVVTDWWALGGGPSNHGRMSGVTAEGVDLGQQTIGWLYNEALANGTDMFGSGSMIRDYSNWESSPSSNYPQAIIDGLASGEVEKANVDQAAARILRFKYNKGLFENPYCDVKAAVELCASAEWAANPTAITSDEELRAARNPYEVELTERLQAKSAVLVKNDDNLLPLSKDAKIYIDGSNSTAKEGYKKYMTELGVTLVDNMEDADVVVGDYASINDATELFIEDAQDLEKPIVLTLNTTKPTQYAIESANALLYLSYSQGADHGSTEGGFVTTTAPWVYVNLLYGIVEPDGVINKEIARDVVADNEQWKDLAGDQGASPYVRLMVQATMEDDPNHASPRNWGDPLVSYHYGMHYGQNPEFKYSCLILPMMQETKEVESGSSTSTQTTVWNQAKAGEPFTVYALLRNTGSDGITTVQAKANGEVVAEKIMTVEGGSWRVVQMDITLDAGEYTIDIGGQTGAIIIE